MKNATRRSLAVMLLAAALPLGGRAASDYLDSPLRRACGVPQPIGLMLAALPENPFLNDGAATAELVLPLPALRTPTARPFHRPQNPAAPALAAERIRHGGPKARPYPAGCGAEVESFEAPDAELFPDEATLSLLDDTSLDVPHEHDGAPEIVLEEVDEAPDEALFPDEDAPASTRRPPAPAIAAVPPRVASPEPAPVAIPSPRLANLPARPVNARPPAARHQVPQAVPVLTFHDVSAEPIPRSIVTPVARFEEMLLYLKAHKYQSVFASRIPALLEGRCDELKEGHRPVVLTFDDGYRNNYELLYPLLKKHDVKITLCLIVGKLVEQRGPDTGNALTWDEVTEMAASGHVEMAAHTFNMHANLPDCLERARDPELFKKRLWADLYTSRAVLEAELGIPVTVFAWPLGKRTPALIEIATQAGFDIIFNTRFGPNAPGHCELSDLHRINVSHVDFGARTLHGRLQAAHRKALRTVRMAQSD